MGLILGNWVDGHGQDLEANQERQLEPSLHIDQEGMQELTLFSANKGVTLT